MNLSAHFHLYHVVGFLSNSLGMSGYESTGLTCFCHQMGLSYLRNSGLFVYRLRFVEGLSTLCLLTESPSLLLEVGG
jgi:hypothetical protein